jgi:hypothetical protein
MLSSEAIVCQVAAIVCRQKFLLDAAFSHLLDLSRRWEIFAGVIKDQNPIGFARP